jgi:6-phosphogluconolactonase
MKNNLHIFKTPEQLAANFADQLMIWIENHSGEILHLAISGGKTPDLLFSVLAEKYGASELWQKVNFWWVDERMVPPDHLESNFGVANRLLFSAISIPKENIHRIKGENDPETEALSYSAQIQQMIPLKKELPAFDLILLGMGDDGHAASIFPDQMELLNSDKICEVAIHPQSGQKRVTLTGRVINNANEVCFLVSGSNKAERLSEVFSSTEKAALLPAAHIHPEFGELFWITDEAACQLL